MDLEPSGIASSSSHYTSAESQSRNPYARVASKRAIACVTCAKAKTKCNKAVPACSRCIAKGFMCEPRSTRRTSEKKHRSNIRKHLTLPEKHHSLGDFSHFSQPESPHTSPPSKETGHTRSMSYDCCSTVKANEEALALSGYPILTPLPTHSQYVTNESQISSEDREQSLVSSEQTTLRSNLSGVGGLSPPTPEPVVLYEHVPVLHCVDDNSYPQLWCREVSASMEYDSGSTLTNVPPPETWAMPNTTIAMSSIPDTSWPQMDLIFQQPQLRAELMLHHDDVCTYSGSQYSLENWFSSQMPDWSIFEPAGVELSTAASAPFLSDMQSGWEDSFLCGPSSYQNF